MAGIRDGGGAFAVATSTRCSAAGTPSGSRGRIISLSMVKNEQDIIEPFIRHHGSLVDAMIILDNGSVDQTRNIALPAPGSWETSFSATTIGLPTIKPSA